MAAPSFTVQQWILLISFTLVYLIFLGYDLFRRKGEKYGSLAYVMAILPANYLWYITALNGWYEFGYTGAMTVLTGLWILGVIRDIFVKDKERKIKDADDVALIIIIAVILNIIVSGVIPRLGTNATFMVESEAATLYGKVFYMPNITTTAMESDSIMLFYKIAVTLLVIILLIPIIIDLRGTKTNLVAIIVISAIFVIPFYYIALLWMSAENIGVTLLLISIVFFITLLLITRSRE